jgi:hypothetical protein
VNFADQVAVRPVGPLFGADRSAIVSPSAHVTVLLVSEQVVAVVPETVQVMLVATPAFITVNAYELPDPGLPLMLTSRLDSVPALGIGTATVVSVLLLVHANAAT